jgi:hypothetical protein
VHRAILILIGLTALIAGIDLVLQGTPGIPAQRAPGVLPPTPLRRSPPSAPVAHEWEIGEQPVGDRH